MNHLKDEEEDDEKKDLYGDVELKKKGNGQQFYKTRSIALEKEIDTALKVARQINSAMRSIEHEGEKIMNRARMHNCTRTTLRNLFTLLISKHLYSRPHLFV